MNTLLFCEEDDKVITLILDGYKQLLGERHFARRDVNMMVDDSRIQTVTVILETKIRKMNVIFDGFLRENINDDDYIPMDIRLLIFAYFNAYRSKNPGLLSRLLYLMDFNNGYNQKIRIKATQCLTDITKECNVSVSIKLCKDHGAMDVIKRLLSDDKINLDDINWCIYWIVTNIACDCFEYVWHSNILKIMIDKFNNESFSNQGQMLWPLMNLIHSIDDTEIIMDILLNYAVIDGIVKFLDNGLIFIKSNAVKFKWSEIFAKIFDLFEHLLNNEQTKAILILQMREFGGVGVLQDIKENPATLYVDIGHQQRLRLIRLLADHFEINSVDDEKTEQTELKDEN